MYKKNQIRFFPIPAGSNIYRKRDNKKHSECHRDDIYFFLHVFFVVSRYGVLHVNSNCGKCNRTHPPWILATDFLIPYNLLHRIMVHKLPHILDTVIGSRSGKYANVALFLGEGKKIQRNFRSQRIRTLIYICIVKTNHQQTINKQF
jgi:hypothetical protein